MGVKWVVRAAVLRITLTPVRVATTFGHTMTTKKNVIKAFGSCLS